MPEAAWGAGPRVRGFGPVSQWTWGNSTLAVRTFDLDGKVTQVDSAGLKTYSYDDAFRITGIADSADSTLSWTYGYDNLCRHWVPALGAGPRVRGFAQG